MKSNKKIIIIISIVLAIVIASGVIAYLYFMTDTFKSNKELFAKYFVQNIESIQKTIDLETVDVYKNLKNENKYESNTNVKFIHSEGGEISDPLNDLALKLDIQKDNSDEYVYADGQILYKDEEYLEAEIIKEQDVYGIRFTDAVLQFVSVKNDENLEDVASDINIEMSQLQKIIDILDGTVEKEEQQLNSLKDKITNSITSAISNGTFAKQKNAMITYNGLTTETNAYSVTINNQLVENMVIEMLNNVKNDTEISNILKMFINIEEFNDKIEEEIELINEEKELPAVKITIYEQNQKTIRTVAEIGEYNITIENIEQNGELKNQIKYIDEDIQADIEIAKKNTAGQENFEISIDVIEGDEEYTIAFSNELKHSLDKIELKTQISNTEDIITESIELENIVNIGNDFEKMQTLNASNNITFNNIKEERRKEIMVLLEKLVPETTNKRIERLNEKFGLKVDEEAEEITQEEINKFNSKFEFYTGDKVSAENVKKLIEVAKNSVIEHKIEDLPTENQEDEKTKKNIILYIQKDNAKDVDISSVFEGIENNKKYKVSIFYKENNGMIDYITITEI